MLRNETKSFWAPADLAATPVEETNLLVGASVHAPMHDFAFIALHIAEA